MKEIKQTIYQLIQEDATFQSLTGATGSDPRIYYARTPQKIDITSTKAGYVVYYRTGTVHSEAKVDIAGRDDQIFVFEIYAKTEPLVEDIGYRIWQLFDEKSFTSTTYIILRSYSVRGASSWDDGRQMYLEWQCILARADIWEINHRNTI